MKNKIILTAEQRKQLTKLWFIYGNNGKKHTHQNHRYIQNILEHGEDTEKFYRNADRTISDKVGRDWSTIEITDECVNEVKAILAS